MRTFISMVALVATAFASPAFAEDSKEDKKEATLYEQAPSLGLHRATQRFESYFSKQIDPALEDIAKKVIRRSRKEATKNLEDFQSTGASTFAFLSPGEAQEFEDGWKAYHEATGCKDKKDDGCDAPLKAAEDLLKTILPNASENDKEMSEGIIALRDAVYKTDKLNRLLMTQWAILRLPAHLWQAATVGPNFHGRTEVPRDKVGENLGKDAEVLVLGQEPMTGKLGQDSSGNPTIDGQPIPEGARVFVGEGGATSPFEEATAAGGVYHGRDKADPKTANQAAFQGLEGREAEAVFKDGRPSVVGPINSVDEQGLRVGETPVTYKEIEDGDALVFIGRQPANVAGAGGTGSGGPADSGVAGDGRLDMFGMYLNGAYGFGVGGDISNVPGVEAGVLLKPWAGPFFVRAGAVLSTVNGMTPYATEDVDDRGTFSAKLGLGLQMDLSNTMALITGVNGLANEAGAGGSVDLLARINLGSVGLFGGINAFHGTLPASLGRDPLRLENPDSTTGSVLSLVIGADLPVIVRSQ